MTPLVAVAAPTSVDLIRRALAAASCSQKVLGARLEVSKARVSRIVHGARLSVANCLRLADLLDEDPAVVLRAYGYTRLGEILHRLYTLKGGARW
jgi:plasmid maintenance system antidote protein VapI